MSAFIVDDVVPCEGGVEVLSRTFAQGFSGIGSKPSFISRSEPFLTRSSTPTAYGEAKQRQQERFTKLFEGEKGLVELCYEFLHEEIIITEIKSALGKGYQWVEERGLWVERPGKVFRERIPAVLSDYISAAEKDCRRLPLFDEKELKKMLAFTRKISTRASIWSSLMIKLHDEHFERKLDAQVHLLPFNNGTVMDLKTGKLRKMVKTDYFSKCFDARFGDSANPFVKQFFSSIMGDNEEKIRFLQKVLGYMVTGDISQKCMFFFVGNGDNGKSVLCNLLQELSGEYISEVPDSVLLATKKASAKNSARSDILALKGLRSAIITELKNEDELDPKEMKRITGGDTINARPLFGHLQRFQCRAKIVVGTNFIPKFGHDPATESRLRFIEFDQKFTKDPDTSRGERPVIQDLLQLLVDQKDDVLAWIVEGAIGYYRDRKLTPPSVIKEFADAIIDS